MQNLWWAYIHSEDRSIHLKRYFAEVHPNISDLEHAQAESKSGNSSIYAIIPFPFEGQTREDAYLRAKEIFELMGFVWEKVAKIYPATNPLGRFNNLELD